MSSLKTHVIQSSITSGLLYPVIGKNVIPLGLSIIFIDLDHVIQYVWDTKSINMRGFFVYFDVITQNLSKNYLGLNIFHTIEFYGLLILLGGEFSFCYYILLGCFFHHLLDERMLIKKYKMPFARAFSIIEYFIKKRSGKYITSIKEVLQK